MNLNIKLLEDFFDKEINMDIGIGGDITSKHVILSEKEVDFQINTRENAVISGLFIAEYFFNKYTNINYKLCCHDGDKVSHGQSIIIGRGNAQHILLVERTILNFLQHLSGISSTTNKYVLAIKNNKTKICDTRKTIPGMRLLQKYAVKCGGGHNHRFSLDNSILIKDNHIAICGSISKAIKCAKQNAPHYSCIEVECETLDQVKEALNFEVKIIMLDNMHINDIKEAVKIINGKAITEVSGKVNLDNVNKIAATGVDYISIGRLTHSVSAIDLGLDIIL